MHRNVRTQLRSSNRPTVNLLDLMVGEDTVRQPHGCPWVKVREQQFHWYHLHLICQIQGKLEQTFLLQRRCEYLQNVSGDLVVSQQHQGAEVKIFLPGPSQWVQCMGIHLPMQGTQVQSLIRADSTYCGATKPVSRSY